MARQKEVLDHSNPKTKEKQSTNPPTCQISIFLKAEKLDFQDRFKEIEQTWARSNQKEGPKFYKFRKKVAATTIGNYLVNIDLWTIYSLSNRLFDSKYQHVEFFKMSGFPKW